MTLKIEALAFQTGLFDRLPLFAVICAPRCFGIVEHPGLEVWLWMEEAVELGGSWSLDQKGRVSRHQRLFKATYCDVCSLLEEPWLTKGRVDTWVRDAPPEFPSQVLVHPLVARV
jgi:hypothetical protein